MFMKCEKDFLVKYLFHLDGMLTKYGAALDKAIELLDANMLCENCPFPKNAERCTVEGCKDYLKECLLKGNKR